MQKQKGFETEGVVQNVSSISTDTSHLQQTMEVQMGAALELVSHHLIGPLTPSWLTGFGRPRLRQSAAGLVLMPMRPSQSEDGRDTVAIANPPH